VPVPRPANLHCFFLATKFPKPVPPVVTASTRR
jgi:hypothetical protein